MAYNDFQGGMYGMRRPMMQQRGYGDPRMQGNPLGGQGGFRGGGMNPLAGGRMPMGRGFPGGPPMGGGGGWGPGGPYQDQASLDFQRRMQSMQKPGMGAGNPMGGGAGFGGGQGMSYAPPPPSPTQTPTGFPGAYLPPRDVFPGDPGPTQGPTPGPNLFPGTTTAPIIGGAGSRNQGAPSIDNWPGGVTPGANPLNPMTGGRNVVGQPPAPTFRQDQPPGMSPDMGGGMFGPNGEQATQIDHTNQIQAGTPWADPQQGEAMLRGMVGQYGRDEGLRRYRAMLDGQAMPAEALGGGGERPPINLNRGITYR